MPSRREVLTLTVALFSQVFVPALAIAQGTGGPEETVTAQPTEAPQEFGEEIVVTGSRIRRKDLTSAAPVTVFTREQVQASGKVTLGDFLQSLPEQGNAINTSVVNGGDGSSRISLRGLGDQRTLVLVNGRRMVGNAFSSMVQDPSADLNAIPTSAIERIEVLKDGASAVYGSDAIAGVVNIITRRKFDGAEVSALAGRSLHGDGTTYDLAATIGTSGESGSLMFSLGYFTQDHVLADKRSWSARPLNYSFNKDADGNTIGEQSFGSGITPDGHFFLPATADGNPLPGGNAAYNSAFAAGGNVTYDPVTGTFVPFQDGIGPGQHSYNFQPYSYLTTPAQRLTMYSAGDHKLGEVARVYYEASLVSRRSSIYQAPEPLALSNEGLTVSASNAYNPFGVAFDPTNDPSGPDVLRRMVEVGPRKNSTTVNTYRIVLGLDGTLPEAAGPLSGWFWDTSIVYGRSDLSEVVDGSMNVNRLRKALGPSFTDPVTGKPLCGTDAAHVEAGCVPLNLFGGAGSITSDQANYIRTGLTNSSFNEQIQGLVSVSGELFRLYADRPVGLALGYELRRNRGQYTPDALIAMGEVTGNKGAGTYGAYTANEGYAELSIPIVNHVPFAETLEATAAARVFYYSSFGSDWTYKVGLRESPVRDITLRGTYSTAYRAPSIIDLYSGLNDHFLFLADPCAAAVLDGKPLPATCTGAAANNAQDPNKQIRATIGGNPRLTSETAKIYTAGIVVEPRWVQNLTLTLDYYNIEVEQAISTYGAQFILDQCYLQGNAQLCNLVTRGVNGQIGNVVDVNKNVGFFNTDGVDLAARYALPTPFGRFGFNLDGTWLHKYDIGQPDGTVIHAKGTYDGAGAQGQGGVYPAFKFNAALTYALDNVGAGISTRYIGTYKECANSSGVLHGSGSYCYAQDHVGERDVGAYVTFDLFLSYALRSNLGRTVIGAGVQNVFDKAPQRVYGGFTAASDPTAYDFMGRFLYLRLAQSL
ncbi:MAG TPA: TonB-dependent receptor [Thermoleophilia bacterium]|nr:TonB-dependent receptor [Thermoleophilia bacterium]